MAVLSAKSRAKIPKKKFALSGKRFPIENKAHAKAALMDAPLARRKGSITKGQEATIDRKARKELKKK